MTCERSFTGETLAYSRHLALPLAQPVRRDLPRQIPTLIDSVQKSGQDKVTHVSDGVNVYVVRSRISRRVNCRYINWKLERRLLEVAYNRPNPFY